MQRFAQIAIDSRFKFGLIVAINYLTNCIVNGILKDVTPRKSIGNRSSLGVVTVGDTSSPVPGKLPETLAIPGFIPRPLSYDRGWGGTNHQFATTGQSHERHIENIRMCSSGSVTAGGHI
jgi:hypothetical protein